MKTPIQKLSLLLAVAMVATLAFASFGCGKPKYVRDTDEPRIDEYTMSLRFDRKDLERLYEDNIHELLNSAVVRRWDRGDNPNVAIFPFRNETSEHIDGQLDTLLSMFETDLVNRTNAHVISHSDQEVLIEEVRRQQSDAYNPMEIAEYGRQMGAQYFITGRVYDVAERVDDQRRVQYSMFVQVIEVETSRIHYQHTSTLTKGMLR